MPKLLQINVCLNLSTGKIAQAIGDLAIANGWESWIAYSGRSKTLPSKSHLIRVGSFLDACEHYTENRVLDREGLASRWETRILVGKIKEIKPNVVHLHNIHDHWLNYPTLFKCLKELDVPVVWTFHDCWAFTGYCAYFDALGCKKWKDGCSECPANGGFPDKVFADRSSRNFALKKELFTSIDKLTIVPVSNWLGNIVRQSFLKNKKIQVIHNGIDLNIFQPSSTFDKNVAEKSIVLGVAAVWSARKGLKDFIKLRTLLPEGKYQIVLVGLSHSQIKTLPEGIKGITRTSSAAELAKLYTEATVFVSPTYEDNFPTTNLEAIACGTPVITYRTGGSPEAIDEKTGIIVEQGDIDGLVSAIDLICSNGKSFYSSHCRKRAEDFFNKDDRFQDYMELYERLLK